MRPQPRNSFRIAIICALALEFDAVEDSFDERYTFADYGKQCGDANFYRPGRIGKHNIVLVCLPEIGKRNAASIASALKISFAKIELTLLVGICGGVPFPSRDTEIILGDVIIGTEVIEYDFGKQYPGGFQIKDRVIETIGRADRNIRSILSVLKTRRIKDEFQERHLCHYMNLQNSRENTWQYPGVEKDRLYKLEYLHKHHDQLLETSYVCALCQSNQDSICDEALKSDCDVLGCTGELVQRDRLNEPNPRPRIHLGSFASGDTVMKSAEHRDKLIEKTKVSGFEMEGAAIGDNLRCVIIKGVSDYSDSHKNNIWQNYAAATAASCAKAFLEVLPATIPEDPSYLPIGPRPPKARDEQFHESSHIMEDTLREESNYQCKISSMTSSIDNMDHHIMSLQEEMRRLNNITNPFFREILVSALAETIKKNSNTSKNSKKTRDFHNSLTRFKFGTIISQTQKVRHSITIDDESSTQYKTTTSLIFYPASWLMKIGLTYGMEATATNSKSGWKYSILPVRAVQNDSLIFRFCESGNVDAVRELFKRGEASVMDINADGWRPLHFATFHGHFDLVKFLISQHADRAALVYESEYPDCFTPASFIDTTATSAIEMMLLFDDVIDFHGPQSDGWSILGSKDWISCHEFDAPQAIDVLSFLIHKYRIDIPDYVDTHTLDYCLISVIVFPSVECLRFIMDSKPEETQDFLGDEPAFFFIARQVDIHMDISQLYFDRGTDVHRVYLGETAFSLSLWFSTLSSKWYDRLKDNGQDLSDFIIRETSPGSVLALVNWCPDTLTDFFALLSKIKIELLEVDDRFDNIRCDECGILGDILFDEPVTFIEPWWEDLKYRMKTEQCICSLLPTQCACGKYLVSCATESSVGIKVHAYGDLSNYSLCHFCEKLYSKKSSQAREADQAMPDADCVNSNSAYHENMTTSWMRYGQVIESLRLFHLQKGRWNGQYHPGQYYCSPCLALREQLYLDLTASAART